MIVQLKWLEELVDIQGIDLDKLIEVINLYSTEVESVKELLPQEKLVVGKVLTKEKHPNADSLSVVNVDVGSEVLQIVCGAPNVAQDQFVIVALEGAILPGDFVIKQTKIRGVASSGMVCSLQELGIEKKYIAEKYLEGIYYFDEAQTIGESACKALMMEGYAIELDITPNRGDLLSMLGVAYEISALFNRPLKPITRFFKPTSTNESLTLKIESNLCQSYYGLPLSNIKIKPSPRWLSSRLVSAGIRPINNVVDITNYILLLYGQPLHAFDYDLLGKNIVVRNAKENEEIITLDGIKRKLLTSDLVITDGNKPVALAGVMGGLETEISEKSVNILLESAVFDPIAIRKTSSRLGLRSESSLRYERGVNLNKSLEALLHAASLLVGYADAKIDYNYTHAGIDEIKDKEINVPLKKINALLGTKLPVSEVSNILNRLALNHEVHHNDFIVYAPSRRGDLTIAEDIVEEVARLYGYNNIQASLPIDDAAGYLNSKQIYRRKIKEKLSSLGLNETLTYSLVSQKEILNHKEAIELKLPLSEERKFMRTSNISSLVEVLKYNYSRKNTDLALFELSKLYYKDNNEVIEEEYLIVAMSGLFSHTQWQQKEEYVDFFLVKGIVAEVLNIFNVEAKFIKLKETNDILHPGRSAEIFVNDLKIGYIGQLHPQFALKHDLDEVYVFELNLDYLFTLTEKELVFKPLYKLPAIERDLAFVVKEDCLASDIIEAVYKTDKEVITDVRIFDLYQGDKLARDEKSIAIKVIFNSHTPLQEDQINKKINKIIKDLSYRFNAKLRD